MTVLTNALLEGDTLPLEELGDVEATLNYFVAENLQMPERTKMYWRGVMKTKELRHVHADLKAVGFKP